MPLGLPSERRGDHSTCNISQSVVNLERTAKGGGMQR